MVINSKHPVYKVRTRRRENIVNHSNVQACEDITVSLGLGRDSRVWVEIAKSGECKRSVAGIADLSSLSTSPYEGHPQVYSVSEQIPESQQSDDLGASDKSKREKKQEGSTIEHTGTSEAAQAVQFEFLEETYSLTELLNQRFTDIVFRETKFKKQYFGMTVYNRLSSRYLRIECLLNLIVSIYQSWDISMVLVAVHKIALHFVTNATLLVSV